MKKEVIRQLSQSLYSISLLSVYEYSDEKYKMVTNDQLQFNLPEILDIKSFIRNTKLDVYMTDEFIIFGIISLKEALLFVGPCVVGQPSEKDAREIILSHRKSGISISQSGQLYQFLDRLPRYSYRRFLDYLQFFYQALTHEPISSIMDFDPLYKKLDTENMDNSEQKLVEFQIQQFMEFADDINYDFETKLIEYVKKGYLDELIEYTSNFRYAMGRMGNDSLSHTKNAVRVLNTLLQRAAIQGGLDAKTAYGLGSVYAQSIEDINDISSLASIAQDLMKEYTLRVKNQKTLDTENEHIKAVISYISQNLYTKLTVPAIARTVNLKPEYLSQLFKKETGISLVNYINQEKINEAKRLLDVTDFSLVEIAEALQFSSQSYFQTVFKKLAGSTPQQYRDNQTSP